MNRLNFGDSTVLSESLLYRFLELVGEVDTFILGAAVRHGFEPTIPPDVLGRVFFTAGPAAINQNVAWKETPMNHPTVFDKAGNPDYHNSWKFISALWDGVVRDFRGENIDSPIVGTVIAEEICQRAAKTFNEMLAHTRR